MAILFGQASITMDAPQEIRLTVTAAQVKLRDVLHAIMLNITIARPALRLHGDLG